MSNFISRMLTAVVLLPLVIMAILWAPPLMFVVVVLVIAILTAFEFITIVKLKEVYKLFIPFALVFAVILLLANSTNYLFYFYLTIALWWLFNTVVVITYPHNNTFINYPHFKGVNALLLLLPFVFVVITLQQQNPLLLLLLLLIVISADSFAYFSGKLFGKHKLHPNLSGGKTIEGVIGGVACAVLFASAYVYFVLQHSVSDYLGIIIITALVSVVGDLYESAYKRVAGVKDSGAILPGHGGMWDRIDALLAAAPIFMLGLLW